MAAIAAHIAFVEQDPKAALNQLLANPITWCNEFLVHVPAIDDQHKKLFELAERLRQVLLEKSAHISPITGSDLKPVQVILHWLVQYCVVHFELEESVQEIVQNPGIQQHKAMHRGFAMECAAAHLEVCKAMGEGRSVDVGLVFQNVLTWLIEHVCGMDRQIGVWCAQKGIDMNMPQLQDCTDTLPEELWDLAPQDLAHLLRNPKGKGKNRATPY